MGGGAEGSACKSAFMALPALINSPMSKVWATKAANAFLVRSLFSACHMSAFGMLANKPVPSIQTAPAAEKTAAT